MGADLRLATVGRREREPAKLSIPIIPDICVMSLGM